MYVRGWGSSSGRPLLCWHGVGLTSRASLFLNEAGPLLADGYGLRVLALDAPGFGKSPPLEPAGYAPDALVDLIPPVLDALELRRIGFMGFSWGRGPRLPPGCTTSVDPGGGRASRCRLQRPATRPEADVRPARARKQACLAVEVRPLVGCRGQRATATASALDAGDRRGGTRWLENACGSTCTSHIPFDRRCGRTRNGAGTTVSGAATARRGAPPGPSYRGRRGRRGSPQRVRRRCSAGRGDPCRPDRSRRPD